MSETVGDRSRAKREEHDERSLEVVEVVEVDATVPTEHSDPLELVAIACKTA